jgi:polysaccharide chain length determinant protein (PEP-CTERM system associated)
VIPGKQYKPEDILEIAWRRRWIVVLPFAFVSAVSVVVGAVLPDRYRSEALLQVMPQQVPENYVKPTVTQRIETRLPAMEQTILSRTQLEQIIQEFNLYPRERKHLIMEDVVERMRSHDVLIAGRNGGRIQGDAFTVGFEATNPKTAMLVAERLASLFIRQNLQDRSVFAEQTDQFLQSQLENTRNQLKEYETRLEEFRRANPGRMPEEVQSNQQALQAAQAQLQAVRESIERDRDRELMLQRMIAQANEAATAAPTPPVTPATAPSETVLPPARQLEAARIALRNMLTRLKPDHPDVKAQQRFIRDLEAKVAAEALQQPVSATPAADQPKNTRAAELQAEFDVIEQRLPGKQEEERKLLASITRYREQLQSIPTVETKLTQLMRDYTTLQATYQSLLTKSEEAKVAANQDRRQIGEQFRIVDAARLPQRPTSPNRPLIIGVGCLVGLMIGLGVAALLEYRDKSLRTEEDVVVALSLPVLALVPTMITAAERQRIRRNRLLMVSSCAAVLVCSVIVITWKFQAIADWIR